MNSFSVPCLVLSEGVCNSFQLTVHFFFREATANFEAKRVASESTGVRIPDQRKTTGVRPLAWGEVNQK